MTGNLRDTMSGHLAMMPARRSRGHSPGPAQPPSRRGPKVTAQASPEKKKVETMKSRMWFLMGAALIAVTACAESGPQVVWEMQESTLTSSLRGLCTVDSLTAWVSGTGGSYAFTRDGGATWQSGTVEGADSLDFRDVEAFADGTAYLMSAGSGSSSRIYKSVDWGASWTLQHTNEFQEGFFDAMAFWDQESGALVGDPVDGRLFLLRTFDGGETWARLDSTRAPAMAEGEYSFAASGTNIAVVGDHGLAVVSGGSQARIFLTTSRGEGWSVMPTPIQAGTPSSGIFSVAYRNPVNAMIVGGDYQDDQRSGANIAVSTTRGSTWMLPPEPHGVGFRSGVAWREDAAYPMWVVVGTSGSDYSLDYGRTWTRFDDGSFNAVAFAGSAGWAAGAEGRVARLVVR